MTIITFLSHIGDNSVDDDADNDVPFSARASSRRSISRNCGLSGKNGKTHNCSMAGTAMKANRKFHLFFCKTHTDQHNAQNTTEHINNSTETHYTIKTKDHHHEHAFNYILKKNSSH